MKAYIFCNGEVIGESGRHRQAVLVCDDQISHIGTLAECKQASQSIPELIDLKNKVLLPAFTDTHTHFVEYAKRKILIDLSTCTSITEVCTAFENYRRANPILPAWILGSGWDINTISDAEQIHKELLDRFFPEHPVCLQSKDYHCKWLNSKALQIAGIDLKTPQPMGGVIARDKHDKLNGLLYESAAELIDRYIVPPDKSLLLGSIRATVCEAQRMGLAGIHSMEGAYSWSLLGELFSDGVPFRFVWHFPLDDLDMMIAQRVKSYTGDESYKVGGVKVFADGALGSQTAWMYQPYSNGSNSFGISRYSDNELWEIAQKAVGHDISLTIHAIGDRCVHQILSLFDKCQSLGQSPYLMHRIEHVQSIRPQDYQLLRKSNAYCALQPVHLANDIDMINSYWQGVNAYPTKDIVFHSAAYGFGSDVPIETINPFLGIYTALTRSAKAKDSNKSYRLEQRISLAEALHGYTLGAAKGSKSESQRGSIAVGKLADLIVLDTVNEADPDYWLDAKARLCMVNGKVAFSEL